MPENDEALVPVNTSQITKEIKTGEGGFALKTVEDAVQFAKWNFESGLLPEHIHNVKQAFAIMARGAELGLKPHASWRWLYMTKAGKIAMETKGMLAVCQASPNFAGYREWIENEQGPVEEWKAVAVAKRKNRENQIKEFSYADAEKAGLLQKKRSRKTGDYIDGPYQLYLKDMLLARARQRALELQFGDVLGGMVSREVAEEVEAREEANGELQPRRDGPTVKIHDPLMAAAQGKPQPAPTEPEAVEAEVVDDPLEDIPVYEGEVKVEEPDEPEPPEEPEKPEEPSGVACNGCGTIYHRDREGCPECGLAQGQSPPKPKPKAKKAAVKGPEKDTKVPDSAPPPEEENPFERGRRKVREARERQKSLLDKE